MDTPVKQRPVITMQSVDSSQIHAIGHDPESNTLAIQFKNFKGEPSSTYHYANFTKEHFADFQKAESFGSHFGKHIKPHATKHPYTKIS